MRGWIDLGSDANWEDHCGMWAKQSMDGSWYVLRWLNLIDVMGERDCAESGTLEYECSVLRLDLAELSEEQLKTALEFWGSPLESELGRLTACINYGYGAPLESFNGSMRPTSIRAKARRYAEECMRDVALLEERLRRPVNKIGSTAAEYGRGDLDSAMSRLVAAPQPEAILMRKITYGPINNCKFRIMAPEHWSFGSCLCSNAEHRKHMIEKWGYKQSDFDDIPLKEEK